MWEDVFKTKILSNSIGRIKEEKNYGTVNVGKNCVVVVVYTFSKDTSVDSAKLRYIRSKKIYGSFSLIVNKCACGCIFKEKNIYLIYFGPVSAA